MMTIIITLFILTYDTSVSKRDLPLIRYQIIFAQTYK